MATKVLTPSIEQEAIYDEIQNGRGHLMVEAAAGSGKTTTLLEGCRRIPKEKAILFCAFNRGVALELKRKAPAHVDVRTIHSLGAKYCLEKMPAPLNEKKLMDIFNDLISPRGDFRHLYHEMKFEFRKIAGLVGLAKANLVPPRNIKALEDVLNAADLHPSADMLELSYALHTMSVLTKSSLDFDDQLYYAVTEKFAYAEFDVIFVDEVQDLNIAQRELLMMALKPGGRVIGCGDPRQSIYSFRGADPDSMANFKRRLGGAKTLPLLTTWRCAESIVSFANEIRPGMRPKPKAPFGSVKRIQSRTQIPRLVDDGSFIIARTNALLVEIAMELAGAGKPFRLQKKEVVKAAADKLSRWVEKVNHPLSSGEILGRTNRILGRPGIDTDDVEIIHRLASRHWDSSQILTVLARVLENSKAGPELMTIHGAKGLEADSVFVLADNLPHSKCSEQGLEQEYNMAYVAVTRAKNILYIIDAEPDLDSDGAPKGARAVAVMMPHNVDRYERLCKERLETNTAFSEDDLKALEKGDFNSLLKDDTFSSDNW
jgi:superfamily I DNA/RNA helicase